MKSCNEAEIKANFLTMILLVDNNHLHNTENTGQILTVNACSRIVVTNSSQLFGAWANGHKQ